MGGGVYSSVTRTIRSESLGYETKSTADIFKERSINNAMDPHGVGIRESRDSTEHPNSVAIVIALDETGSMGSVPHFLVKEGFPHIMETIIKAGILDPQVLFMGIGDHISDSTPLQVGQFESSDELLDKWLTTLYLEGNGGAGDGESYSLAWYFAAFHTEIDCLIKRGQRGLLITVGDEPCHPYMPASFLRRLMGEGQYEDFSAYELLEAASRKYNVFHINVKETRAGSRPLTRAFWSQLLSDGFVQAEKRSDVARIIADLAIHTFLGNKPMDTGITSGTTNDEMML